MGSECFSLKVRRVNLVTYLKVLSPAEVGRLLDAAPGPGLKYKAALSIAYGAGLRAGEVMMLRVSDIDSKRRLIRVERHRSRLSSLRPLAALR